MRGSLRAGLCLALVMSAGMAARAETLTEALARAYAGNPTLKAGRLGLGALDENVAEAVAAWRPSVTLGAGHTSSVKHQSAGPAAADYAFPTSTATLQVSQRLLDFGQTDNAIRAAEERVKAGRAQLLGNEQNILLTATQAYMDVLKAQAVVDLNQGNVDVLDRQLAAARAGFERSLSTRTDVAQAEARRADAQASLEVAQEELDSARAVYEAVIGAPPSGLVFPSGLPSLPRSLEDSIQAALAGLPAVVAAERNVQAASAERSRVEASLLPTVTLQGQSSWSRNPDAGYDMGRDKRVGVEMTWPIYAGGVQQARIRGSVLTLGQRRQERDAAHRTARREAVTTWNGLLAARARVKSFQASVQANQIAYQGTQAEYQRMGTRSLLDVLDAEHELFTAQVNLTRARRDEVVAAYQVLASIGGLTAGGLALPVKLHDAETHLETVRGQWFGTATPDEE